MILSRFSNQMKRQKTVEISVTIAGYPNNEIKARFSNTGPLIKVLS